MPVRPYLRRFVRKFVFDVIPGALASLVGAMLFAQHWPQPAPAVRVADAGHAVQSQEITRLVREEHDLMVAFIKQTQERDAARAPLTVGEIKAKEAALVAARRPAGPVEPGRDVRGAPAMPPATSVAVLPLPSVAARPAPEIVMAQSGPLVPPEPKAAPANPESKSGPVAEPKAPGSLSRVTAWAFEWADKAVDVTGLRHIPGLVRTIRGGADTVSGEFQTISDARLIGAPR